MQLKNLTMRRLEWQHYWRNDRYRAMRNVVEEDRQLQFEFMRELKPQTKPGVRNHESSQDSPA